MTIKKLADDTRALLLATELGAPVVALIDELAAAETQLLAANASLMQRIDELTPLQARVAELEAAELAADVRCLVCGGSEGIINGTVIRGRLSLTTRAESELADLRKRVAEELTVSVYGETLDGLRIRIRDAIRSK